MAEINCSRWLSGHSTQRAGSRTSWQCSCAVHDPATPPGSFHHVQTTLNDWLEDDEKKDCAQRHRTKYCSPQSYCSAASLCKRIDKFTLDVARRIRPASSHCRPRPTVQTRHPTDDLLTVRPTAKTSNRASYSVTNVDCGPSQGRGRRSAMVMGPTCRAVNPSFYHA